MGCAESALGFASVLEEAFIGDDLTYRMLPLLATLSTLLKRARLAKASRPEKESLLLVRLFTVSFLPLSMVKFGVL